VAFQAVEMALDRESLPQTTSLFVAGEEAVTLERILPA
jgi:hypothetical protein